MLDNDEKGGCKKCETKLSEVSRIHLIDEKCEMRNYLIRNIFVPVVC